MRMDEFEFLNAEHEPTPEELEKQESIEKERERNRMRCQKRKAARYYDKPSTEPKKTEKRRLGNANESRIKELAVLW